MRQSHRLFIPLIAECKYLSSSRTARSLLAANLMVGTITQGKASHFEKAGELDIWILQEHALEPMETPL
jgi:hypothetical protein